jgi:hypothetical protein
MSTSKKTLEALCELINTATGSPLTPYTRTESGLTANLGNFHLSGAYGGVCVHRMHNQSGGVTEPIWSGHISKAKAETKMRAYLRGLEMPKAEAANAQLIALAPDLLEALYDALPCVEESEEFDKPHGPKLSLKIRALLAKAEGVK